MTFRETLNLYKNGTLTAEEAVRVEKELEKYEAISDYLYEEAPIPQLDGLASSQEEGCEEEAADRFTKMIRDSIRRAFVKMGILVGTVVLAVVLAVIFVLPHAVSLFFYDPNKTVGFSHDDMGTEQMDLELAIYSELFLPGKYRDTVTAEAEGYGKYRIIIPQISSVNGRFTGVAGRLDRGRLTLYDPNLLSLPTANAFVLPEGVDWSFQGTGAAGSKENAYAKLEELDDAYYIAYFSFSQLTDYETFYNWFTQNQPSAYNLWCGVYNQCTTSQIVGFCPNESGWVMDWDREKYPKLRTLDSMGNADSMAADAASGAAMQTHFVSMLRYLQDHPHVMELFGNYNEDWSSTIADIEENGMMLFGFAVTADKETILALSQNQQVAYVYTQPLP